MVGGGFGVATGAAMRNKYLKTDDVAVCFFGDGAANEGNFHECLNMASIWNLPVVFVNENNLFEMCIRDSNKVVKSLFDKSKSS